MLTPSMKTDMLKAPEEQNPVKLMPSDIILTAVTRCVLHPYMLVTVSMLRIITCKVKMGNPRGLRPAPPLRITHKHTDSVSPT